MAATVVGTATVGMATARPASRRLHLLARRETALRTRTVRPVPLSCCQSVIEPCQTSSDHDTLQPLLPSESAVAGGTDRPR
jgi:hypothetical protein